MWTRTGFADEVADDLTEQIALLTKLGVRWVEFRSAWGINVLDLSDKQLDEAKRLLDQAGIRVSSVGSPIGKVGVIDDFEPHLERMRQALHVADHFGAANIRLFSFYIPEGDDPASHRDEVLRRMTALAELAEPTGVQLLHENEWGIYGDVPQRCADLAANVAGLKLIFDPANYVQCGVRNPVDEGYDLLAKDLAYIHIKDAVWDSPDVVPAGQGDGQVRELLARLKADGYGADGAVGFFSIEPHLGTYTHFGAQSGPELWTVAHDALTGLFDELEVSYA